MCTREGRGGQGAVEVKPAHQVGPREAQCVPLRVLSLESAGGDLARVVTPSFPSFLPLTGVQDDLSQWPGTRCRKPRPVWSGPSGDSQPRLTLWPPLTQFLLLARHAANCLQVSRL